MSARISQAQARQLGIVTQKRPARTVSTDKVGFTGRSQPAKAADDPFVRLCVAYGLPEPVREYRFHPGRRWRADWAFIELRILVEVEGGAFCRGRHVRGAGFVKDLEKYAEAVCRGWTLLRVTPQMVEDGRVFGWLKRIAGTE